MLGKFQKDKLNENNPKNFMDKKLKLKYKALKTFREKWHVASRKVKVWMIIEFLSEAIKTR